MRLSRSLLSNLSPETGVALPTPEIFSYPEKVLQFGTGVLLRGLPDFFIDKANRTGLYKGRIVVVKSTAGNETAGFDSQDFLYTHCIRGLENGLETQQTIVNSSISRILLANSQWPQVLALAGNPDLELVISNTTEVGISLTRENIHSVIPASFPGKLLAFLWSRYQYFGGSRESGLIIIPTELIVDNADKLLSILKELAKYNSLPADFEHWLGTANEFCNSLVDRIVPGVLKGQDKTDTERLLGYQDDWMILSETYRLWAIETGSEKVQTRLSFRMSDPGVVVVPDIEKFRELKLRLLNGAHTCCCGLAVLMGFSTVKEAMSHGGFREYITRLMLEEISPAIVNAEISLEEALEFSRSVLDRFGNPFLEHRWLNICLQYSAKMKMRNVPTLLEYYRRLGKVPRHLALGWAAYMLFMKTGWEPPITDDLEPLLRVYWEDQDPSFNILGDERLWGVSLVTLPGWAGSVSGYLHSLEQQGPGKTLELFNEG